MPGSSQRTNEFSIEVPADRALIHDVRERFEAWFREAVTADRHLPGELTLALSELVANAMAAAPRPDSTVRVHAHAERGDLVFEVSNPIAPWVDGAIRYDLSDPLRTGGRGLLIVRALMDDVDAVQDLAANMTTVRCRRSLH